jgi:acetoacetate decarboxylase
MGIGMILVKTAIILANNDLQTFPKQPTTWSIQTTTQRLQATLNYARL